MPSIDDRSSTAKALSKVSEILALCLLMVVPALIGSWIDRQFSTVLLFTLLGLALGMTGAVTANEIGCSQVKHTVTRKLYS